MAEIVENVDGERALWDYIVPLIMGSNESIQILPIIANNFEIKPITILDDPKDKCWYLMKRLRTWSQTTCY